MACAVGCPGNAISKTKSVKLKIAGHDIEWGDIDCDACGLAFIGGKAGSKGDYLEKSPNSR